MHIDVQWIEFIDRRKNSQNFFTQNRLICCRFIKFRLIQSCYYKSQLNIIQFLKTYLVKKKKRLFINKREYLSLKINSTQSLLTTWTQGFINTEISEQGWLKNILLALASLLVSIYVNSLQILVSANTKYVCKKNWPNKEILNNS